MTTKTNTVAKGKYTMSHTPKCLYGLFYMDKIMLKNVSSITVRIEYLH